jgi:hypothetical protein
LTVLLGLAGLAIDALRAYDTYGREHRAAEAATLAGVLYMPNYYNTLYTLGNGNPLPTPITLTYPPWQQSRVVPFPGSVGGGASSILVSQNNGGTTPSDNIYDGLWITATVTLPPSRSPAAVPFTSSCERPLGATGSAGTRRPRPL